MNYLNHKIIISILLIGSIYVFSGNANGSWYYDYNNPYDPNYNSHRDINPKAYWQIYKYPRKPKIDKKEPTNKKEKPTTTKTKYAIDPEVAKQQEKLFKGEARIIETNPKMIIKNDEVITDDFPILPNYPPNNPYKTKYAWGKNTTLIERLRK